MSVKRTDMAGGYFVGEAFRDLIQEGTATGTSQRTYTVARWTRGDHLVAEVNVVVLLTASGLPAKEAKVRTVVCHGPTRKETDLQTYFAMRDKSEYPAYLRDWLTTHYDNLKRWEQFFLTYHR